MAFSSGGTTCHAWHFAAAHDGLRGPSGRPVVIMGHGFAGTKDSGLESFARALAAAGLDVLAFDYRGFGASGGLPRQVFSRAAQVADYDAAMAAASRLPGVDPDRLVVWGVSMSGGMAFEVAAGRPDVAAIVALTPLVSGPAAARSAEPSPRRSTPLRAATLAVRDKAALARGRARITLPVVARPDEVGILVLPGMLEDYLSIAGPTWCNEMAAAVVLDVMAFRPNRHAADVTCPTLVQIADFDRCAPPHAAAKTAFAARAVVHHYPADHFDVYEGKRWHDLVVADQVRFLSRVLTPAEAPLGHASQHTRHDRPKDEDVL